ncbi:MAG TPA: spore germination protein [Bacillales bacterium]|nr:spore germination protein [Bacillales bacterium]
MHWNWFREKVLNKPPKKETTITELLVQAKKSIDFVHYHHVKQKHPFWISYFKTMINPDVLHTDILSNIKDKSVHSLEQLKSVLPLDNVIITDDVDKISNKLYEGFVLIQSHEHDKTCLLASATERKSRQINVSEVEFSVLGPKAAFIEDLDTNINLIRQRLPMPQLTFKEILAGKLSKTKVVVVFIDGITNEENVNTVTQRLQDLEFDEVADIAILQQLISDNANSMFPVTISSEKPDRVAGDLANGKVAVLQQGSSQAMLAPTSFFESFIAREDYYMPWILATGFRLIRYFAVLFSVLASSLYVAVLTYHYEMIPKNILGTLIASRVNIPFPPVIEALFLELTIELLREAGARLPTKVGQTLGIVGGIVIGQAVVAASLTSNVLLIIVALAALASFTTPFYKMSDTIRLLRFPFILCAAFWGGLGIVFCFSFFIIHLLRLTSLGRPYLYPFYPPRLAGMKEMFIRASFSRTPKRFPFLQTEDSSRYNRKRAKEKHDIDE